MRSSPTPMPGSASHRTFVCWDLLPRVITATSSWWRRSITSRWCWLDPWLRMVQFHAVAGTQRQGQCYRTRLFSRSDGRSWGMIAPRGLMWRSKWKVSCSFIWNFVAIVRTVIWLSRSTTCLTRSCGSCKRRPSYPRSWSQFFKDGGSVPSPGKWVAGSMPFQKEGSWWRSTTLFAMWSCGSWQHHRRMHLVRMPIGWSFAFTVLLIGWMWPAAPVQFHHRGWWSAVCQVLPWSRTLVGVESTWLVWRARIKPFICRSSRVFMLIGLQRWKLRMRMGLDLAYRLSLWSPTRTTCTWSVRVPCSGKSRRSSRRKHLRSKHMIVQRSKLRQFCHQSQVDLLFSQQMLSLPAWRRLLVRTRSSKWCTHTKEWPWLRQMFRSQSPVFLLIRVLLQVADLWCRQGGPLIRGGGRWWITRPWLLLASWSKFAWCNKQEDPLPGIVQDKVGLMRSRLSSWMLWKERKAAPHRSLDRSAPQHHSDLFVRNHKLWKVVDVSTQELINLFADWLHERVVITRPIGS